jgi:hypothetical protein
MRGGFIARTFIQDERVPSRINPLVDDSVDMDIKPLVDTLKEISKIVGRFSWSENGKSLFKEWYTDIRENMTQNPEKDPTGTMNRIHDQGLKIAMLLSLSRSHNLILELDDMEDAIRSCTEFMTLTKAITAGSGEGELSLKTNYFLSDLLKAPEYTLSHVKVIQRRFGDMNVEDITRIVDMLSQGELIEIIRNPKLGYKLTEKAVKEFGGLLK